MSDDNVEMFDVDKEMAWYSVDCGDFNKSRKVEWKRKWQTVLDQSRKAKMPLIANASQTQTNGQQHAK